jgi:hypothetical protein
LPLTIYVPGCYWNQKHRVISKKLPVSFGDVNELDKYLLKMIRRAEDLVFFAKEMKHTYPIPFLKQHFYSHFSIEEITEK